MSPRASSAKADRTMVGVLRTRANALELENAQLKRERDAMHDDLRSAGMLDHCKGCGAAIYRGLWERGTCVGCALCPKETT